MNKNKKNNKPIKEVRVFANDTRAAFLLFVGLVDALQNRNWNSSTYDKSDEFIDAVRELMGLSDYAFINKFTESVDKAGKTDAKELTKKLLKQFGIKFVQYDRASVPRVAA